MRARLLLGAMVVVAAPPAAAMAAASAVVPVTARYSRCTLDDSYIARMGK